jgi:DNA-binding response OmpR family regulator
MKALVFGQQNTCETLSMMLKNEGIEMQTLDDDIYTTNLSVDETHDLAIVDSRSDNANKVCHYIRENWDIPLVLIVDSLQADWKCLKPIEADGYISDIKKSGELSARARALLRRLLLKQKSREKISGSPKQTLDGKGCISPV